MVDTLDTNQPIAFIENDEIKASPYFEDFLFQLVGGGSAITVQDDSVTLTTGVTKFNFIGFNVTEPVTDEIEITLSGGSTTNELCPGYNYSRVDDDTFTVDLANAENLFYVGRRVKIDKAGSLSFGVVSSVDFDSTNVDDTTVNLTMEGIDTVPTGTFDVCLVSGVTAWSPIATDPFVGSPINDITTGAIGSTQWWVMVGDSGKLATSDDKGVTWTIRTTSTTENINVITYDRSNEEFWAGGNAGVLLDSSNGSTWNLDTTKIPTLAGTGNSNIIGFDHSSTDDELLLIFQFDSLPGWRTASSSDGGAAWVIRAIPTLLNEGFKVLKAIRSTINSSGTAYYSTFASDTNGHILANSLDTTYAASDVLGATNVPLAMGFWYDSGEVRIYGCEDGDIIGIANWTGDDLVTFSNPLRDFAYSLLHSRAVVVGDNGSLGYLDSSNKTTANAWTSIPNGFDPLTDINAVDWNEIDSIYIAVASNGQICRSTNGTN